MEQMSFTAWLKKLETEQLALTAQPKTANGAAGIDSLTKKQLMEQMAFTAQPKNGNLAAGIDSLAKQEMKQLLLTAWNGIDSQ